MAQNGAALSEQSEVKTMVFHYLPLIQSLTASNITANSVSLSWKYPHECDGFMILVNIRYPYPKQSNHIVTSKNITIDNLPPGVRITFKVAAFKGSYTGPSLETFASTVGDQLATIPIRDLNLVKDMGNSVKISWDRVKDSRKVKWVYGVYYGLTADDLLEGARLNTTDTTVTVHNLDACESYVFSVGLIAPFGTGPILKSPNSLFTYINDKAPPKKVSVQMVPNSPLQMLVQWAPSCSDSNQPKKQLDYLVSIHRKLFYKYLIIVSYVQLEITDKVRQKKIMVTVVNATGVEMSKVFNVSYGATYDIRIKTNIIDSKYSEPVTYSAPPIMPPHSLMVVQEMNGSYVIYWNERSLPEALGDYNYEILVSEGEHLNASTTSRYTVRSPPFIFDNHSAPMYSFSVRLRTNSGYSSDLSETHTVKNLGGTAQASTSNAWSIAIPVCLLIAVLLGAVGFLAVKYRRLQYSFTRFANSHYDTRSEAATFDDNILDEDDTPQIRGFSDDEPLVVA